MKKLKIGIIGNGGICKVAHLPCYIRETTQAEIVALCDIKSERAEEIRDKYFPNAISVIDSFHVVKMINHELHKYLLKLMKEKYIKH